MKQLLSVPKKSDTNKARRAGAPCGPRKAGHKRSLLIKAASELFIEKGYDKTSMDEVAAAANVAKGTLYHYFTNKSELLLGLREDFEKEVMGIIRPHVESLPEDDWVGRIKAWADSAVSAYFQFSELHDVAVYGEGMPFRNAMADAEITMYLTKLITDGADAGAWKLEDADWTSVIMFYSFRGGCDEAMLGKQPAEAVKEKLKDMFLRILGV